MPQNIINSALKFIENILHKLGKDIQIGLKGEMSGVSTALDKSTKQQSAIFGQAVNKLENAIKQIKEPKFSGKITVDTTKLEKAITDIKNSIKPTKLDDVRVALKIINTSIQDSNDKNSKELKEGMVAIAEAMQALNLTVPSTFKLDEMQLRKIAGAKSMSINGGELVARNATTANVSMTNVNTEYSYTFPANTTSFHMKVRAQNAKFKYSWTSGASGTTYMTTPQNSLQSRPGLDIGGKTIYFQSDTASQVMEIDSYQL